MPSAGEIDIYFFDSGRKAECPPDPKFPDGRLINLAESAIQKTCCRNLPYPAPACGMYMVECRRCGFAAMITVAGRPDDPRMVQMPCARKGLS